MKKTNPKKILNAVMEALCPDACVGCGEPLGRAGDRVFCPACRKKYLNEISAPCPSCGKSYDLCECRPKNFLPDGYAYFLPYDKADGVTRKALLCCKNRRVKPLFAELAGMMLETAKKRGYYDGTELVTYVPRSNGKGGKTRHRSGRGACAGILPAVRSGVCPAYPSRGIYGGAEACRDLRPVAQRQKKLCPCGIVRQDRGEKDNSYRRHSDDRRNGKRLHGASQGRGCGGGHLPEHRKKHKALSARGRRIRYTNNSQSGRNKQ